MFIHGYVIALTSLFNPKCICMIKLGLMWDEVGWWERGRGSTICWVPTGSCLMCIIESLQHHCKAARNWFPTFACGNCSWFSQCYPGPVKHRLWVANEVSGSQGHFSLHMHMHRRVSQEEILLLLLSAPQLQEGFVCGCAPQTLQYNCGTVCGTLVHYWSNKVARK